MSIITDLANVATGGLAQSIVGAVEKYFPPDLSPELKNQFALAAENLELQKAAQVNAAAADAEKSLNERIALYEGTAADLKSIPVLGAIMIFARGAQRPIWGFATLWMDWGVFSGTWNITGNQILEQAFYLINALVLSFLFGERAIANLMPLITNFMAVRQGK